MTSMSLQVGEYTSRVLGVIKEKFGLKDKAEALDKFADLYGEEFVEKEVKEELITKMIQDCAKWEKTGKKKMSIKELDKLCEV
ncbi:hypothetical protein COV18_00730 [Candidatus Woesearchaeota archaeon CG10_big_fil_rev_8_21_14_0_10_37_12]|nr:MAG: hypothetical protein COV18_00730 [Candidatus Woesearchaeota archaeon CG10_big_fil_rev_8_21_14_0_10_37_12]